MKPSITFTININGKTLIFHSGKKGLEVNGVEYVSGEDGVLVYDKIKDLHSSTVICQLSSNTSTLIPALRVLDIAYNRYFDEREVLESQNNISFYWNPSRLAAFYNRYSTDNVHMGDRELIIRKAVDFLIDTADEGSGFLPEELLTELNDPCELLGFYHGIPVFNAEKGLPMLVSRLGIHIGNESIMISTPMDRYSEDIEEVALELENATGRVGFRKKNRVRFERSDDLLNVLLNR